MDRSGGKGERFFFYFSGHGLTNESSIDPEEAIVMADFDTVHTDNALEIRSFIEFFKSTRFKEQFFIVDACRNVLDWGKNFRTREFTLVDDVDPNLPAVQQYTLLATSPRTSAVAIGDTSAFTEEFLNGLKGKPMTVALDTNTNEYVVTTSRLFSFVEKQILDRKIIVSGDENNPIYQTPRINGEHGSNDPELARLKADEVEKINLRVFVDPDLAWAQTEVTILDQFGDEKWRIKPVTKTPENRALEPMFYTARASAPGYKPSQPKYPINLYTDLDVPVTLIPEVKAPEQRGRFSISRDTSFQRESIDDFNRLIVIKTDDVTHKSISWPMSPDLDSHSQPTRITIATTDNLARLELMDSMGKVVSTGQGKISEENIDQGFYRARLLTPEGQVVEKLVSLESNEQEEVVLDSSELPTSPVVQELRKSQFSPDVKADDFARRLGLMAAPQLSTVLALAGSEVNQEPGSNRYRDFGIRSFKETVSPGTKNGVQILSGSEGVERNSARLRGMKVRLWRIGRAETNTASELTQTGPLDFYQFSQAIEPGHYFLSVGVADEDPAVFVIAVLPERLTMLVLQYDASGSLLVFQYNLPLTSEREKYKKLSPDQVRRLELAQRFCLSGRLDYALETGVKLLYDKWADPLAGCLGGYLLLRLGKPEELEIAANNMVRFYGSLSDSHVLRGEYEASLGNEGRAKGAFEMALNLGVPIFAEGLTRLGAAVQKYQLQHHPNAKWLTKVDSRRVRGYLWTAWRPSKEITPREIVSVKIVQGDQMGAGRDFYHAAGDMNIAGRDNVKVEGNLFQFNRAAGETDELDDIFADINQQSRSLPEADKVLVALLLKEANASARSIQNGDRNQSTQTLLETRLTTIIRVQPELGELVIDRLSNPAGNLVETIVQIAKRAGGAVRNSNREGGSKPGGHGV